MTSLKACGLAILAVLLALPAASFGQKNANQNAKSVQGTSQEYALLKKLKEVVGRLAHVDSSTKDVTIDIDYQYPVPNKNYRNVAGPRNYRGNYVRGANYRMPNFNAANFQRQMHQQQQLMMTIRRLPRKTAPWCA
jgi:hypothetical protein